MSAIELTAARAAELARLALANLRREYPYKPGFVHASADSARPHREVHAVFWGSFDWHSSVHGHWMLVRLLRAFPEHPAARASRDMLDVQLTREGLASEARFFEAPENRSFERMYGWAWLFRLALELELWDDGDARRWREHVRPLEERLVASAEAYLERLQWPLRSGTHSDSGFALALALDHARATGRRAFEDRLVSAARRFYARDRDYPARFEPSGEDFFSSGLNAADLMRRVMVRDEFSAWLDGFLPGLARGEVGNLASPVEASDLSDGRLVHLVGLNLSRAWTWNGIASALAAGDARREVAERLAALHAESGLRHVCSGHYEGDHWLASFAVYLLTKCGVSA